MKRMAVFGHKGYLGGQLLFYAKKQGWSCFGYDLPECDVLDDSFWTDFDPLKYDVIAYFSGLTGTDSGFISEQKYLAVNEGSLLKLLSKLVPLGAGSPKVVFPSSRLVYRGSDGWLSEDSPKETKTVYAVNKLACEGYLSAYANRFGIRYATVRICVPYGSMISADYSYGTLGFFLQQIKSTNTISLYGDGSLRRTFTHVADIVEVVLRIADGDVQGVFNIGGDDLSLSEAAQIVATRYGANVKFVPWPQAALALESGSTVFDARKLASAIGFGTYRHLIDSI